MDERGPSDRGGFRHDRASSCRSSRIRARLDGRSRPSITTRSRPGSGTGPKPGFRCRLESALRSLPLPGEVFASGTARASSVPLRVERGTGSYDDPSLCNRSQSTWLDACGRSVELPCDVQPNSSFDRGGNSFRFDASGRYWQPIGGDYPLSPSRRRALPRRRERPTPPAAPRTPPPSRSAPPPASPPASALSTSAVPPRRRTPPDR